MGNAAVKARRQIAAEQSAQTTLRTLEAVRKFRKPIERRKSKIDLQIKEIMETRFKRKSEVFATGGFDLIEEPNALPTITENDEDDGIGDEGSEDESPFLMFIKKSHVSQGYRKFSIADTSLAWSALRESMLSEERRRSNALLNSFRKVSNALGFLKHLENQVEDELEPDVEDIAPYTSVYEPEPFEMNCHYCNSPTLGGRYRPLYQCRLCPRGYHRECLKKRGHLTDELQNECLELSQSEIGWTCPECESLFWLLSDSEKVDLMETFDEVDVNKDSIISREEYINYQELKYRRLMGRDMPEYRHSQEMRIFNLMDRDGTGLIDWWEFMTPMTIDILSKRKCIEIIKMLLPCELDRLRRFFNKYDSENTGCITLQDARRSFREWYVGLIDRDPRAIPISDWLGVEEKSDGRISIMRRREVTWSDYLKQHALALIAARPNTGSQQPYIPRLDTEEISYGDDGI